MMNRVNIEKLSTVSIYNSLKRDSLHYCMKNILILSQICAFIPVDGISGCPHDLKFRWRSYKTIYTLLVLLLQTIYTLITIIYATKNEKNFNSFVLVLWNFRCVLSLIAFLKVAQKWPRFMQEWSEMELFMIDYPSFLNLNRNLRIKSIVFLLPGLFEHLLFIYKGFQQISHTTEGKNNPLKIYFEQMYKEVFDLINFNPIVAIMVEVGLVYIVNNKLYRKHHPETSYACFMSMSIVH
ncbi:gustatory receptor for sugar taste 64f-like [Agrilus planipennis]|uniref:Gustatory receptor for sugar taste 64f-like n=1 Tax=Agrilus planipennis TaxID=224129 RepID=A0A1W4W5K4_AGRPL|nr:gustatory receptor for sugar taste 64f-like [Agrilus planipennis]